MAASVYRDFVAFCDRVEFAPEPFQKRIARTVLGTRESLVLLPRGNGKSRLMGALAVHHLLAEPRASAFVAAASRQQATVIYQYARDFALHPSIADRLVVRHLELRADDGGRLLVLASDAPKLHGLTPSFVALDELHAFRDAEVYLALRTALLKRPGARMATISTAGTGADSPLGQLRARALALPHVTRRGAVTEATGPGMAMLEWAVSEHEDALDPRTVKRANPASWLTPQALAAQRDALPEPAYRRYHADQWLASETTVFAPGAWQACAGTPTIADGDQIVIAVDASKGASDAAVVWVNENGHIGVEVIEGTGSAEAVDHIVSALANRYRVRELTADPWHVVGLLTERWEQRGIVVSEFPQFDSRLVPATERLIRAVHERRLVHPDHPKLDEHVEGSMLRDTRRGPRIDKRRDRNNDALVALCLAWDRLEHRSHPAKLLGWI